MPLIDSTQKEREDFDDIASQNLAPYSTEPLPSFFDGGASGIPQGAATAGLLSARLLDEAGLGIKSYASGLTDDDFIEQNKRDLESLEENKAAIRQQINDLKPDPLKTGGFAQITHGFSKMIAEAVLGGAPAVGVATFDEDLNDKIDQGVDLNTATQSASVAGVTGAAMTAVPMTIGGSILTKAVTGAGINIGVGAAQRGIEGKILRDNGYTAMADQYKAIDGTAIATDALMGIAFGTFEGVVHGDPLKGDLKNPFKREKPAAAADQPGTDSPLGYSVPPETETGDDILRQTMNDLGGKSATMDAAMAMNDAQNYQSVGDAVPTTPEANNARSKALDIAADQLLNEGRDVADVGNVLTDHEFMNRAVPDDVAAGLQEAAKESGITDIESHFEAERQNDEDAAAVSSMSDQLEERLAQQAESTGPAGKQTGRAFASTIRNAYDNLLGRTGNYAAFRDVLERNLGSRLSVGDNGGQGRTLEQGLFDKTDVGDQNVIPGAERISDKELAERKMNQPLQGKKAQKSMDIGLFDDAERNQRTLFQSGLRSNLVDAAANLKQAKGSGDQMLGILKNVPGVKEEEIAWTGLDEFLKGKKSVTKEEISDYLDKNQVQIDEVTLNDDRFGSYNAREEPDGSYTVYNKTAGGLERDINNYRTIEEAIDAIGKLQNGRGNDVVKFSQYTLPGGENYREVLLTLPMNTKFDPSKVRIERKRRSTTQGSVDLYYGDQLMGKGFSEKFDEKYNPAPDDYWIGVASRRYNGSPEMGIKPTHEGFRSSHFEQPNILAHVRLNDRTDADGKRVLFVEEIQSDWHQAGRKKGYKSKEPTLEDARKHYDIDADYWKTLSDDQKQAYVRNMKDGIGGSSDGVPDAPFKKNWQEMAFRRVAQMAAQGDYDRIAWTTGDQQFHRYPQLGEIVDRVEYHKTPGENGGRLVAIKDGRTTIEKTVASDNDLDGIIGKEPASRLIEAKNINGIQHIEGEGLKSGGEGMRGFYDNILVKYANKFGKKFGTSVGKADLPKYIRSEKSGQEFSARGNETVHSMDITPEMRESAKAGFELFQHDENTKRGKVVFGDANTYINLFKGADASTLFHESGHLFMNVLREIGGHEKAPNGLKRDWGIVRDWLGIKEGEMPTVEQEERFARGFEQYIREGKAPSEGLKAVFKKFKKWLGGIYKAASDLNVEITPEIRGVMDRLLASDADIKALRDKEASLAEARKNNLIKKPQTLRGFVRANGGVKDTGGDLRSQDFHKMGMMKGVINNKNGLGMDVMAQKAADYFKDESGFAPTEIGSNTLIDGLMQEANGKDLYRRQDIDKAQAISDRMDAMHADDENQRYIDDMRGEAEDRGYPALTDVEALDVARLVDQGVDTDEAIVHVLQGSGTDWEVSASEALGQEPQFEDAIPYDAILGSERGPDEQGVETAGGPESARGPEGEGRKESRGPADDLATPEGQILADDPEAKVSLIDNDGNISQRPLAELIREADDEIAQAGNDARLFDVAVSCFLRNSING